MSQMIVMRAELAAVIAGADPRRAALGTKLDDCGDARPHRRSHRLRGESVDDDLENRARLSIERAVHRAAQGRAIGIIGRRLHALVFRPDLGPGADDPSWKRRDHVGTLAIAAAAASAAASAAFAVRPITRRLPPPTAFFRRPVVASQTNSPSMTGIRQKCFLPKRLEICQPSPK